MKKLTKIAEWIVADIEGQQPERYLTYTMVTEVVIRGAHNLIVLCVGVGLIVLMIRMARKVKKKPMHHAPHKPKIKLKRI